MLTSSSFTARAGRLPGALIIAALVGTAASAADLTPEQVQRLNAVRTSINKLQTNLKLAADAAGPGDARPKGSRAKLALTRLNSAKAPIPGIKEQLAQLPADNADVKATQKTLDEAVAYAAALEKRITGKAPSTDAPAEEGKKLDYRQEEQLKNARFSLRDLKGRAAALAELINECKQVEDQRLIDFRRVQMGMNTLEVADRRIKETRATLEQLPEDGRGVQATRDEFAAAIADVEASRTYLAPLHNQLQRLIHPATYPNLREDIDRLADLARMFHDTNVLVENRPRAVEIIRTAQAAVAERERIVKQYALLVHQKTKEGEHIAAHSEAFARQYLQFAEAVKQQAAVLPKEIEGHLAEARQWASEAVAEKKPLFFTGGIPQTLGFAEDKLALLARLDPDAADALRKQLAETRAKLEQQQESLRVEIIAANELPPNEYAAGDRAELEKLAIAAWKKRDADAKVLAVRIPASAWKRSVKWLYSSGGVWSKVDSSRLQAHLLVAHDDQLAVIRPVNLWKDHLSNDAIEATLFHSEDDELRPQDFLLRSKIK